MKKISKDVERRSDSPEEAELKKEVERLKHTVYNLTKDCKVEGTLRVSDEALMYDVAAMICLSPHFNEFAVKKVFARLLARVEARCKGVNGTPEQDAALARAKEMIDGVEDIPKLIEPLKVELVALKADKEALTKAFEMQREQAKEAWAITHALRAKSKRVIRVLTKELLK